MKDKLFDYLKDIKEKEDLHGKLPVEKTREILLKYFKDYTFDSEEQAINFFYAFDAHPYPYGKDPIGKPIPKRCAEVSLSEIYWVNATMDELTLKIKHRPSKEYSWNKVVGWHEGYDMFIDTLRCFGETLEEARRSLHLADYGKNYSLFCCE